MKRRNTPNKKRILEIFESSKEAICSSMLEDRLIGEIDRSTIYRILLSFEEDGLIHKIVDPSGKIFYAACKKCTSDEHVHNHFHFKCEKCEKIECLDEKISLPELTGYKIKDFFGVVNGLCFDCA
jgi:Fur family ferric uptake transcriptional regulator